MDGELRDGCQYSYNGLSCSGRETADLVNWVDGLWVRRAFHERSMLDCHGVRAQVASYSVLRANETNCLMRQRKEDFWQSCVRLPKPSELLSTRMVLNVADGFRDTTSQ